MKNHSKLWPKRLQKLPGIKPALLGLAMLALASCDTVNPGPPLVETAAELHLVTTDSGARFYNFAELRANTRMHWSGGADEAGFCHGKGEGIYYIINGDTATTAYTWLGTYNHGKAEGKARFIYIQTMTSMEVLYQDGRIVAEDPMKPIPEEKREKLLALVTPRRKSAPVLVTPPKESTAGWIEGQWLLHDQFSVVFKADGTVQSLSWGKPYSSSVDHWTMDGSGKVTVTAPDSKTTEAWVTKEPGCATCTFSGSAGMPCHPRKVTDEEMADYLVEFRQKLSPPMDE